MEKKGQKVELVSDQNSSPEAPPTRKRGGSKEDVRKGAMDNDRSATILERKEVRRDYPIEPRELFGMMSAPTPPLVRGSSRERMPDRK